VTDLINIQSIKTPDKNFKTPKEFELGLAKIDELM
jgi:hypothetical protein